MVANRRSCANLSKSLEADIVSPVLGRPDSRLKRSIRQPAECQRILDRLQAPLSARRRPRSVHAAQAAAHAAAANAAARSTHHAAAAAAASAAVDRRLAGGALAARMSSLVTWQLCFLSKRAKNGLSNSMNSFWVTRPLPAMSK